MDSALFTTIDSKTRMVQPAMETLECSSSEYSHNFAASMRDSQWVFLVRIAHNLAIVQEGAPGVDQALATRRSASPVFACTANLA